MKLVAPSMQYELVCETRSELETTFRPGTLNRGKVVDFSSPTEYFVMPSTNAPR